MKERQIVFNTSATIVQVVLSGVVLFVIYRFLLNTVGIAQLGVWSIVTATTTLTRAGDFGLSGSIVKFVAKYRARNDEANVVGVINTALISIGLFIGGLILLLGPLYRLLFEAIVPAKGLSVAVELLPFALFSLWVSTLASVFQASLNGCQRNDLYSLTTVAGQVLYLFFALVLVPSQNLLGIAYAQAIQSLFLLVASGLLLKKEISSLSLLPRLWSKPLFREMLGYGLNFQVTSIAAQLMDPLTKVFLTKFGGLSQVGYYEMANRLILQLRSLLVSANQVFVPVVADMQEQDPSRIKAFYLEAYEVLTYVSIPFYGAILAFSPLISVLWIGHFEQEFITTAVFLTVGWFINNQIATAYSVFLGVGKLRWNTLSQITTAILNACLGLVLGQAFGAHGVLFAWILAVAIGSGIVVGAYHREQNIPLIHLLPRVHLWLVLGSIMGVSFCAWVFAELRTTYSPGLTITLAVGIYGLFTMIPFYNNPVRVRIVNHLAKAFPRLRTIVR